MVLVHTKQGYSGAWLTTGTTSVIKWGSLSNVNAGTEILGTTLFKLLNLIERRKLLEETDKIHYFKSDDEIAEYVLKRYSGLKEEHIALLCINQKGKILGFKIINEGDMSTVGFSTRKLAEVAINCGATTVILCHNHPSGMPLPSYLDEEATRGLQNTLSQFGIYLRDHLIVANNECYSMRKSGKYSDIFGSIR